MVISKTGMEAIKAGKNGRSNNRLIGNLMMAFNRSQNTIENWVAARDLRLTTPTAVHIIKEHTGLTEAEILEDDDFE